MRRWIQRGSVLIVVLLLSVFGTLAQAGDDRTPTEQIAFVSERDGDDEIYIMDADGGSVQRVTDNVVDDWYPAWSPDASQIAFASNRGGRLGYYIVDVTTGETTQVTRFSLRCCPVRPSWSPDGTQLVYGSPYAERQRLTIFDLTTHEEHYMDVFMAFPMWSPDGESIAYLMPQDGVRDYYQLTLFYLDSGEEQPLAAQV